MLLPSWKHTFPWLITYAKQPNSNDAILSSNSATRDISWSRWIDWLIRSGTELAMITSFVSSSSVNGMACHSWSPAIIDTDSPPTLYKYSILEMISDLLSWSISVKFFSFNTFEHVNRNSRVMVYPTHKWHYCVYQLHHSKTLRKKVKSIILIKHK